MYCTLTTTAPMLCNLIGKGKMNYLRITGIDGVGDK